jgi:tripartite-type tricarboxylate transporter receptor subunit TctC
MTSSICTDNSGSAEVRGRAEKGGPWARIAYVAALALAPLMSTMLTIADASAQEHYPSRPVKIIVPYPAGGPNDVVARLLADKLGSALGGRFYVENVPGAAGSLGARAAASAAADGYTLLCINQDFLVQPLIKANPGYDAFNGFAPVSLAAQAPEAMFVHPSVLAKTVAELVALIKANPGKYSYASPGFGTTPHLAGERLFRLTHSLDVAHVAFQGGAPAVTSTVGGHTQILLITIGAAAPHVKDNALRALAIAAPTRWLAFPDVPTMAESGLTDHDAEFIVGLVAPAGTPNAIVERLSSAIARAVTDKDVKDRFNALGLQPAGSTPAQFQAKLREVSDSWAKVVSGAGIKSQ